MGVECCCEKGSKWKKDGEKVWCGEICGGMANLNVFQLLLIHQASQIWLYLYKSR